MKILAFTGLEDYIIKLEHLSSYTPDMMEKAIYPGAGMIADAVKGEIESLPVGTHPEKGEIVQEQKDGLLAGFGVAPFSEDDGFTNVKLGFDGYNAKKTKKYPSGQPNALIACAVESGTSFRRKNAFISRAVRRTRAACEMRIGTEMDRLIQDKMEG